jgi:hypothetical protein
MSKSYFSKYKIEGARKNIKYPNKYKDPIFGEMNPEIEYDYDYSHTTDNEDKQNVTRQYSRHPNKTVRHNLTREFKKYGVDYNAGLYGGAYDNRCVKRERMPMLTFDRKVQNGKRRFKFKKETKNMIDEALNG